MSQHVSWEESMFAVFEDLEQQAEGLAHVERDAEVADLSVAEYARVLLAGRLHASLGQHVRARLLGGLALGGRLARVGEDWLMLVDGPHEWVVRQQALLAVTGLSGRADREETWSVVDRLSLRAVLRRLSSASTSVLLHATDGQRIEGRVGRVGQDFVELHVGEGRDRAVQLVALGALAALQGRD